MRTESKIQNLRCQVESGFTLTEMLVSMAVLAMLVALIAQLFNNASTVTSANTKHLNADGQARLALDRMAVDLAQMLKRADVDYYCKTPGSAAVAATASSPAVAATVAALQIGNDQIAFYSEVPGYYSGTSATSTVSLVGWRVNSISGSASYHAMERLGKGLVWNGTTAAADIPIVYLPLTIADKWPAAANNDSDSDYETVGSNIFRFEYYYVLKTGEFSVTPWDTTVGSTGPNGFKDVAAISVAIAVIDPKTKAAVSDDTITALIAKLPDFAITMKPGELEADWQTAISATTSGLPAAAASAIRVYGRTFYLNSPLR